MGAKRKDWRTEVKGLLKAELKRRNLTYADLAKKLAAIGVTDNGAISRTRSGAAASPPFSSCNACVLSAAKPYILNG